MVGDVLLPDGTEVQLRDVKVTKILPSNKTLLKEVLGVAVYDLTEFT